MATSTEPSSNAYRDRLSEMTESLIEILVISPRIEQLYLEVHEILHITGHEDQFLLDGYRRDLGIGCGWGAAGTNGLTEIPNGCRAVTGNTALRLGQFFGMSGEFRLNLQKLFELWHAEHSKGAAFAGRRRPAARLTCGHHQRGSCPKGHLRATGFAGSVIVRLWRTTTDMRLRALELDRIRLLFAYGHNRTGIEAGQIERSRLEFGLDINKLS